MLLLLAHLLLLAGFYLGGWALRLGRPALHLEAPSLLLAARLLGTLFLSSWAMASIHTWLASRFSNLGVNLGLGITGVGLIAVASRRPEMARCLPWAMPSMGLTDWMGPDAPSPWLVAGLSVAIGTLLLLMACLDAGSRESAS